MNSSLLISILLALHVTGTHQWKLPNPFRRDSSDSDSDDEGPDHYVEFLLYTRENLDSPNIFYIHNNESVGELSFRHYKQDRPTKVVIPGWRGHANSKIDNLIRPAYLVHHDLNVIVVDWSGSGSKKLYPSARGSVPEVARNLAFFLDQLHYRLGTQLEQLHVIGFSLGAHMAGIAGRLVTTGKIGRLTGLDPARPLFSEDKPLERLTPDSALFVDVIHTCTRMLGMPFPVGHVDFYPNGLTRFQPGCYLDVLGVCSHRRAYKYFAESIVSPRAFIGRPCDSWKSVKPSCEGPHVVMGEYVSTSTRGVYYLETNKEEPYGQTSEIDPTSLYVKDLFSVKEKY